MSVLVHRSSVSQIVPRTVAEAYRPFVKKLPLPLPQRRRTPLRRSRDGRLPLRAGKRLGERQRGERCRARLADDRSALVEVRSLRAAGGGADEADPAAGRVEL